MHKKFVRRCFLSLLSLALLGSLLWWLLVIEGQSSHNIISSKDVTLARQVLSGTLRHLNQADDRIELQFEQKQLDALMNVATYTATPLKFSGVISDFGVAIRTDWQLTANRMLSGYCLLLPGPDGFAIDHCKLGKIPLAGSIANYLLAAVVKLALASPADQQLLSLLRKGELSDNKLYFVDENASALKIRLNPQLYTARNMARDLLHGDSALAPDIDIYLAQLRRISARHPQERRLAFFSLELLLFAQQRAGTPAPVHEYQQALWALATVFGNRHFIRYANPDAAVEQIPVLPSAMLAGRQDLSLHFLYSAVFQQLGGHNLSTQIGNLKEILDADTGGSGFSFVDLAADRAGILFAERLADIAGERLHSWNADDFEAAMMPTVHDLPENLSEQQVISMLGGYQGEGFRALERLIQTRLDKLILYN